MDEPKIKKKATLTESAIKKQKQILVIAVICIITLFVGTSYSLLTNFDTSEKSVTFKSGKQTISATKIDNLIKFYKNYEVTDDDASKTVKPVVLSFENIGSVDINKYTVKLVSEKDSFFPSDQIMFTISTDLGVTYQEAKLLQDDNNIIYVGSDLKQELAKTIYLKAWYVGTKTLNATNNTYLGKLEITFD